MLPMTVVALLSPSMSACGDDEDDGAASTSAGVLDSRTGLRVKGFGDYRVCYDSKGRIDYIRDDYGEWEFSYNPNKISYVEIYNGQRIEDETLSVSYNSSGCLSSANYSDSGQDEDEKWNESSQASLSYDGSGHLTKITGSGKESGIEKGERYSESWTFSYTLTWRNNILQQVVWTEKWVEDGETETETETWTFSYDNDSYENEYHQWAPSIGRWLDDIEELYAYVGLLGVGPSKLPSSAEKYEEEFYDGKNHTYYDSYSFSYGFNSDGSISYTFVNGTRYSFSYDYAEINGGKTRASVSMTDKDIVRKMHHLFKRTHHKH